MTQSSSFGKRVRFHRKRRGLLQWELGALLSRSEDWVYRVEADRIPVNSIKMFLDLAQALRVQVKDLCEQPTSIGDGNDIGNIPAIRSALMQSRQMSGSLYMDREIPGLERLRTEVDAAWECFHAQPPFPTRNPTPLTTPEQRPPERCRPSSTSTWHGSWSSRPNSFPKPST
ncbi:multiprotein-bridging factor 1 family protein [Streptomyces sp. NPDC017940]|uniref:multiprotein-bridging factor 1 family protein n=1 Tax=Streptomyces sp. NPDC017940 TaxID=3365017 RepID=UPI00378A98BE